jgi:hypothetical protein
VRNFVDILVSVSVPFFYADFVQNMIATLLPQSLKTCGVKLLASIDISTRAPWITQNEQHFVAG